MCIAKCRIGPFGVVLGVEGEDGAQTKGNLRISRWAVGIDCNKHNQSMNINVETRGAYRSQKAPCACMSLHYSFSWQVFIYSRFSISCWTGFAPKASPMHTVSRRWCMSPHVLQWLASSAIALPLSRISETTPLTYFYPSEGLGNAPSQPKVCCMSPCVLQQLVSSAIALSLSRIPETTPIMYFSPLLLTRGLVCCKSCYPR